MGTSGQLAHPQVTFGEEKMGGKQGVDGGMEARWKEWGDND